ncbi:hypothetical protein ACLOJK_005894 [Asimina triloba]
MGKMIKLSKFYYYRSEMVEMRRRRSLLLPILLCFPWLSIAVVAVAGNEEDEEGDETFVASVKEEATLVEMSTLNNESEMVQGNALCKVMQDVLKDVEFSPQCPVKMDPQRRKHVD